MELQTALEVLLERLPRLNLAVKPEELPKREGLLIGGLVEALVGAATPDSTRGRARSKPTQNLTSKSKEKSRHGNPSARGCREVLWGRAEGKVDGGVTFYFEVHGSPFPPSSGFC